MKATLTVCSYGQGFGEVAQALVLEARVNAVAGHSMKLYSNHTVSCLSMHRILFNGGIG